MIVRLAQDAGIQDGILALIGSALELDRIHVSISGHSVVLMEQGVPEGGLLGPLAFPSYMNSLTQALEAEGCGVGLGICVPDVWKPHEWQGRGCPVQSTVEELKHRTHRICSRRVIWKLRHYKPSTTLRHGNWWPYYMLTIQLCSHHHSAKPKGCRASSLRGPIATRLHHTLVQVKQWPWCVGHRMQLRYRHQCHNSCFTCRMM